MLIVFLNMVSSPKTWKFSFSGLSSVSLWKIWESDQDFCVHTFLVVLSPSLFPPSVRYIFLGWIFLCNFSWFLSLFLPTTHFSIGMILCKHYSKGASDCFVLVTASLLGLCGCRYWLVLPAPWISQCLHIVTFFWCLPWSLTFLWITSHSAVLSVLT